MSDDTPNIQRIYNEIMGQGKSVEAYPSNPHLTHYGEAMCPDGKKRDFYQQGEGTPTTPCPGYVVEGCTLISGCAYTAIGKGRVFEPNSFDPNYKLIASVEEKLEDDDG